jgi:hypothetical protein
MTPRERAKALERVTIVTEDKGGGVLGIGYFCVPRELRGQGVGRAAFAAFVQQLDASITRLELLATDEERQGRHSEGFWRALGFVPKYDQQTGGEDLDILDCDARRYTLWRGVNGRRSARRPGPQPPPVGTAHLTGRPGYRGIEAIARCPSCPPAQPPSATGKVRFLMVPEGRGGDRRFCLMDECAITFGRRTSTRTSVSYHIANTANSPRGALRYSVCCLRVMTFHERGGKVVCSDPPATPVPAWTCGRTRFGSSRVLEALMSSSVSTRCWAT